MTNSIEPDNSIDGLKAKLLGQTACIAWIELQRFFAQGKVLQVDNSLDLVEVATWMSLDNVSALEPYIENGDIEAPSNDQARYWYDDNTKLWSVVVAPYVLVQEQGSEPV